MIKTETGHLSNVLTKIQTTVKNLLDSSHCPTLQEVNKLRPLRFRANEKKLSLARIKF